MTTFVRAAGLASLGSIGLLLLVGLPLGNQPQPALITTDTEAYCAELLTRMGEFVRAETRVAPDVARLVADGTRLCQRGEVRRGILRLRRAMLLVRPAAPRH